MFVAACLRGYRNLGMPSLDQTSDQPVHPESGPRCAPGQILANRYRIVAVLGKGGMGEVFRADDLTLGQSVAVKFLQEHLLDPSRLARFRQEVASARQVSHSSVCRVYDIVEEARGADATPLPFF